MHILIFFTLFLVLPRLAASQTFGGIGTRAEGMGGAFVAVADDASAVYWNPAGLATGATFDFQVAGGLTPVQVQGADPSASLFLGAAMPVLGLSFYRTHTVQALPDRQNGGSGRVQIRLLTTSNIGVTVVQTVVPKLVIGTTARLVRGGIEGTPSRTTADVDAGAMVSAGTIRVGITGRNLKAPEYQAPEGPVKTRRQVRIGAALVPRSLPSGVHGPFSLSFDADLVKTPSPAGDDVRMAAVGGEYWLGQGRLGARGGLRWNTLDADHRAVSGGLTLRLPRSVFVEGQVTKPTRGDTDNEWQVGVRLTF
jgi:hypothetical protein